MRTRAALIALLGAGLLAVALGLSRGEAFWSTSDGVYALTARTVLDGSALYSDTAAAQPPGVYLVGAGLLAVDDSLASLRAGLALAVVATALLTWLAVVRLTGRAWLGVVAAVAAPLTPVALHEHALLTPETLGAPLLLGCALLAARPDRAVAAGLLGAVCVAFKLSFALPVALVLLAGAARRRSLLAATAGVAGLLVAGLTVHGTDLLRATVTAQRQTGFAALDDVLGQLAQEAWTAAGLVAAAAVGVWAGRGRARDPVLLRTLAALSVGGLLLGLSVVKLGSYVNTVQPAEAALLALGVAGTAWLLALERRVLIAIVGLAAVLTGLQSASLIAQPADPLAYTRPGAESGPRRLLSEGRVQAAAASARARCADDRPYPGIAFIAFVAGRRLPGDQPDRFILGADVNRRFAERAFGDRNVCPNVVPTVDARGVVSGG